MIRPCTLILLTTTLALPACIIEHGLGETAEDSSGGSGSRDGGSTGADPSATSGQLPGSGDSTGSAEVTTDPTDPTGPGPTGDSGTETDGEPGCEPGDLWVQWAEPFPEPLPGIDATFAAVLSGDCLITEMVNMPGGMGQPHSWEIHLDCTLSGRVDSDASITDQPFSPVLMGTSSVPFEQWWDFWGPQVQLRVVLDWWGMGWSRYVVLEADAIRPSTLVLDMVSGEYTDPLQGVSWQEEIQDMLGGQPWHGGITMAPLVAECDAELGPCGEIPQALEIGWPGFDPSVLHGGQDDDLIEDMVAIGHHASLGAAEDITQPICTDMPLGDYRVSVWAVEAFR